MLVVKNLSKYLYGEPLFEQVSFVLHKKDHVGLIGPNGSGKSTLLKILSREIAADSGSVNIENERIGYLPQQIHFNPKDSIMSFLSGYTKLNVVLGKVGLGNISLTAEVNKLSGGQKTRLALAKVLLTKPTLLLLDEPTNHLDLDGLKWLEAFIQDFKGGVFIVSHDRKLLDNCVTKIFELALIDHAFNTYEGGYSTYLLEKKRRFEQQEGIYERQQKEKHRMEAWLLWMKQQASAHPDPSKGKKIRAMEKRIQREIYDKEIPKPREKKTIKELALSGDSAHGKLIARVKDLSKSYSNKVVFRDISFEIRGKEHILLTGANGSGKTTLLKILVDESSYDTGEVIVGENVKIGYFAQEHETLNPEKTVVEELLGIEHKKALSQDPRSILGPFLFRGQDVFKKVADLSLGERVRLMFAKLTLQENQLLILDEPTNHLDIESREVIENSLLQYKGAILVVSHDRYFLDKIGVHRTLSLTRK